MKYVIAIYRGIIAYGGMTLNGLCGLLLLKVGGERFRTFNHTVLSPFFCGWILRLIGIRVRFRGAIPTEPVVFMFNHNSFLDIFIVPTLKLPNTRFIISQRTDSILPLRWCNRAGQSLMIPVKSKPVERLEFFERTKNFLLETRDRVICAPEGVHTFTRKLSKFNRGVFHMALLSKRPIAILHFNIPPESDPLEGYFLKSGTVNVDYLGMIRTDEWKLETLDQHIASVREIFVQHHLKVNGEATA